MKLSPTQEAIVQHLQTYCEGEHYYPGAWICIAQCGGTYLQSLRALERKGVIEVSDDLVSCGQDRFIRLLPPYDVKKKMTRQMHHLVLEDEHYETLKRVLKDVDMHYEHVTNNRRNHPCFDEQGVQEIEERRRRAKRLRDLLK